MRRNSRRYQPKHLKKKEKRYFIPKLSDRIFILSTITFLFVATLAIGAYADIMADKNTAESAPEKNLPIEIGEYNTTYLNIIKGYIIIEDQTQQVLDAESMQYDQSPTTEHAPEPTPEPTVEDQLGNNVITIGDSTLTRHDLPSVYYSDLDFSSFQPYMPYTAITNTSAPAYNVVYSEDCYTDEMGFRRYKTDDSQFTIDGQDDYVIALGTFYKEKGMVGNRYLIVTSTGMYTAKTGDEKSDRHTDEMHMFTIHDGDKAGIIEWIVDYQNLDPTIKRAGTVTIGGPEILQGEILHIYEIQ